MKKQHKTTILGSKSSALLISALLAGLGLVFFQNCSGQKFGTADISQICEDCYVEAGESRTITMASKYNSEISSQPVKVVLIVDNSNTMANSQQNLARNLTNLFSEISKYDSDIILLSTSLDSNTSSLFDSSKKEEIISATEKKITATYKLKPNMYPTWKIAKADSDDVRQQKLLEIGNKVKQLGTSGNQNEQSLKPLSLVLEGLPEFFPDNSRVLVFIISDEDDSSYAQYYTKETVYLEKKINPTMYLFDITTVSMHRFTVYRIVNVPIYDDGILTGYRPGRQQPTIVATAAICQAQAAADPINYECEIEEFVDSDQPMEPSYCANFTQAGYTVTKCVGRKEERWSGDIVKETLSDSSWFGNLTAVIDESLPSLAQDRAASIAARETILYQGIRDLMNTKFKENYLIAAQVNLPGQSCTMGPSQSYDTKLQKFSQVLPAGHFMASSICDASATSGLNLKNISERMDTIISRSYRVIKAQNEVISAVRIVKDGQKTALTAAQYKFENGLLVVADPNITDFLTLEVDLTSI